MGKKIKLPLEIGLSAICNHIRAVKQTAEQSGSAVSALAQATAESLTEIEGILNEKQDASNAVPFTIPATGWVKNEITEDTEDKMDLSAYPYYIDIALEGMSAKDRVDVTVGLSGSEESLSCGLCPFTEAFNGKFRLRATQMPSTSMAAEYWLFSGKE